MPSCVLLVPILPVRKADWEDVDREELMLFLSRDYNLSRDNAPLTAPKGSVTVDRTFR